MAVATILDFHEKRIWHITPWRSSVSWAVYQISTILQGRSNRSGSCRTKPMFGRIHKFSTTLFDLSVKPRTKQSAWNNKQGKANMCVWFWVCNLLIYFSAHVSQIGRSASECLPGTRVPWAITVGLPVWPLSGAWCQSAWCAATEFEESVFPVGWIILHQGIAFLQELSLPARTYFSEVVKVVQLILVMPATNAVSEHSFSTMRRIKSYLRSTMRQDRLNHLMTLIAHLSR